MSRLLIHEPPLMFQKSLANAVGLNEAIFIQQLHYWLLSSNNVRDGRKWVYKTRKEWLEGDFTFFSESTLKRVISNLRASGLLLVANYNKMKQDKTLWYSIDYEALVKIDFPSGQNDLSMRSKWPLPSGQNDPIEEVNLNQALTREYTENTQENTHRSESEKPKQVVVTDDVKRVIDYLNSKAGTRYTYDSAKTVSLLKRLFKQGRTVDDIKRVIDVKCAEWLPRAEMRKFLRPRTLFSDKFEDYLNQVPAEKKRVPLQPTFEEKMQELYGDNWREAFEEGS